MLDDADRVLASLEPSRPKALALLRWQLLRLLRSYQLFKHVELFDPLCRGGDRERARRAAAMKARCIETSDAFGAYVERWSAASIDASWRLYQEEARQMVLRLRYHLRQEAAEAELLLVGIERTRAC